MISFLYSTYTLEQILLTLRRPGGRHSILNSIKVPIREFTLPRKIPLSACIFEINHGEELPQTSLLHTRSSDITSVVERNNTDGEELIVPKTIDDFEE